MEVQRATLAAGCFWGVEEAFRTFPGVLKTRVGYTGGHTTSPTYEDVCRGGTGHAEAVEVTFDPSLVSYESLVNRFFEIHDPTQMNRQGPDVGEQYRSAIFYHDEAQRGSAESAKTHAATGRSAPIATSIEPATSFFEAEEYHQQYFLKNGGGTCHI